MQRAQIRWFGGQEFVAKGPSGHAIVMDSDRDSNVGCGPMELLMMAMAACMATDVVIILKKKREKLETLEVICSGERATDPPQVWTKMDLLFRASGDIADGSLRKAIVLSEEKYCSVSAMLRKTAAVSWRYEIVRGVGAANRRQAEAAG
jgi:putative redox protein